MNRLLTAPLLLLLSLAFPAQQKFTSIRQIDFRNFSFLWQKEFVPSMWSWMPAQLPSRVELVNGRRNFPNRAYLGILATYYGRLSDQEVAAVDVIYASGGTANWHYLYIYRLKDGEPERMGWLRSGSRADGGLLKVDFQNGLLVLDFQDPSKRDGDCCSDGYIRVTYRWQDGHFVEVLPRRYGLLPARTAF